MRLRLLLLLLLCCCSCLATTLNEEADRTVQRAKQKGKKRAASWRRRYLGGRKDRKRGASTLLEATGGMCHYIEREAFSGACIARLQHGMRAPRVVTSVTFVAGAC